jgi:hypothetical protein
MKKVDIYKFVTNYEKLSNLEGFDFIISIAQNYSLFKDEMESYTKARSSNLEYKKYKDESQIIISNHSEKDESGNPLINTDDDGVQSYKIDKDRMDTAILELNSLTSTYKDAINKQDELELQFYNTLEENTDKNFIRIKKSQLPSNITQSQITLITWMIDWEM